MSVLIPSSSSSVVSTSSVEETQVYTHQKFYNALGGFQLQETAEKSRLKFFLCLRNMKKVQDKIEVQFHTSVTMAPDGGEC
jgi:hypothetical protein